MRGSKPLLAAAVALTLIGIAPFASVLIASSVADALGCRLDEGSAHACLLWGMDIGGTLYAMGVMGWLMLVSIWPLLLAPVLWIAFIASVVRDRRHDDFWRGDAR